MSRTGVRPSSKARPVYRCTECDAQAPKWLGRCTECGAWSSLVEERASSVPDGSTGTAGVVMPLAEGDPIAAAGRSTGVPELDRVLGGGLVPGSVTLLGGEPGIGKSTLLVQVAAAQAAAGARVLYVSAEESKQQVRLRAERLRVLAPSVGLGGDGRPPDHPR